MVEARAGISYVRLIRTYGTVAAGILIILAFSLLSPDSFATIDNAINISRQISFLVIIALGATLVMSVGEFDLSVGAVASFGGVFAAQMAVAGYPIWLTFLAPMAIAFVIGFVNGWIVTRFRVLSFITTLAMGTILGGLNFRLTGGATVFENIPDGFRYLGQSEWGGIPVLSFIMLFVTLIFWYVMSHMSFGRKLYAIGGNESASRVAGVRVALNKNMAFALCAMLATLTYSDGFAARFCAPDGRRRLVPVRVCSRVPRNDLFQGRRSEYLGHVRRRGDYRNSS